jgi:cysteine synthase B
VSLFCVQAAEAFNGIEGLIDLPTAIQPGIYDPSLADRLLGIETEEAFDFARRLARLEGLFAGSSTGANLAGAAKIATDLAASGEPGVVVAIGCDGGARYLTTGLWDV